MHSNGLGAVLRAAWLAVPGVASGVSASPGTDYAGMQPFSARYCAARHNSSFGSCISEISQYTGQETETSTHTTSESWVSDSERLPTKVIVNFFLQRFPLLRNPMAFLRGRWLSP